MLKNLVIWLVIGLVLMTVFNQFNTRQSAQAPMEYSQFLEEVKAGRIAKVTIEGRQLKATTSEGKRVTSYSPGDIWLVSDLLKYGVKIEAKPEEEPSLLMNIFVSGSRCFCSSACGSSSCARCRAADAAAPSRSASRARACWTNRPIPSPSPTSRAARKRKRKWPSWSTSCATRPSSRSSAGASRAAC
jgi:ATP-dependent Zn protease